jgi:hypothetical protein
VIQTDAAKRAFAYFPFLEVDQATKASQAYKEFMKDFYAWLWSNTLSEIEECHAGAQTKRPACCPSILHRLPSLYVHLTPSPPHPLTSSPLHPLTPSPPHPLAPLTPPAPLPPLAPSWGI